MKRGLVFDNVFFEFRKATRNIRHIVRGVLVFFLGTFGLTVLLYAVFALLFSTDTEKMMKREIRMYRKLYPSVTAQSGQVADVLAGLQYKDNDIYAQLFHSNAPSVDPMNSSGMFDASDSIPDSRLVSYTRDKADRLLDKSSRVDEAFARIAEALGSRETVVPPMRLPVGNLTYTQVGASVGSKVNPFLGASVEHGGIDLIVPRGTRVLASAGGVVRSVEFSKGLGRVVTIEHEGGYSTLYAHLESADVVSGAHVKAGAVIGTVGMTGQAYAPHLHYEVHRRGAAEDPVNHFFASITPDEYANMLYMSVNTMQSMD